MSNYTYIWQEGCECALCVCVYTYVWSSKPLNWFSCHQKKKKKKSDTQKAIKLSAAFPSQAELMPPNWVRNWDWEKGLELGKVSQLLANSSSSLPLPRGFIKIKGPTLCIPYLWNISTYLHTNLHLCVFITRPPGWPNDTFITGLSFSKCNSQAK